MSAYAVLKAIHIVSSAILFGTGLGIAFFKWTTDRTGDVRAIRIASEKVVLADWLFTTPAIIIQPITGIALAAEIGFPLSQGWIETAIILYVFAGVCWLPVVWLQVRMRALARVADLNSESLPTQYFGFARAWFWLGVAAFLSLLAVFWLMVAKPM